MKASKTLARPEYWQDFENLCKKLWGEIWKYPEIKKNGRSGQDQAGVDIYGIPQNETEYYGIQCKGKDEYTHKQLTEKEIDTEIEKAKNFKPKLKKLYFATTAVKDARIEEYVRLKNLEHSTLNLFEVHLFCWEDIVDLINENKQTYDYYLGSINFKTESSVEVTFQNGETVLTVNPKFIQKTTSFSKNIIPPSILDIPRFNAVNAILISNVSTKTKINHSFFMFDLRIKNTGSLPIENYKLHFELDGNVVELKDTNEHTTGFVIPFVRHYTPNTRLNEESLSGTVYPKSPILVGDDSIVSEDIYIKAHHEETTIKIRWRLLSKHYKTEGELLIHIIPNIELERKTIYVKDASQIQDDKITFEDFIEVKDKSED